MRDAGCSKGTGPPTCIQHIQVVQVVSSVISAEDEHVTVHHRTGVEGTLTRTRASHFRLRPTLRFCNVHIKREKSNAAPGAHTCVVHEEVVIVRAAVPAQNEDAMSLEQH